MACCSSANDVLIMINDPFSDEVAGKNVALILNPLPPLLCRRNFYRPQTVTRGLTAHLHLFFFLLVYAIFWAVMSADCIHISVSQLLMRKSPLETLVGMIWICWIEKVHQLKGLIVASKCLGNEQLKTAYWWMGKKHQKTNKRVRLRLIRFDEHDRSIVERRLLLSTQQQTFMVTFSCRLKGISDSCWKLSEWYLCCFFRNMQGVRTHTRREKET